MNQRLIYVELKSGYSDDGPAWIGLSGLSKSGKTVYFSGKAFKSLKGSGVGSNYYEIETGDEYWISGVKKNGHDRHSAGTGEVMIDEIVVEEYLKILGASKLHKNFKVVRLLSSQGSSHLHNIENEISNEVPEFTLGRRPIKKHVNRLISKNE